MLRHRQQNPEAAGLVFWSGEQLFVVLDAANPTGLEAIDVIFPEARREPDALDRVGTIAARPETNRPGLSGMINDRDEWVVRVGTPGPDGLANTEDDQQAILLGRGE